VTWTSHDRREVGLVKSQLRAAMRQVEMLYTGMDGPDQQLRAEFAAALGKDAALRLERFSKRRTR
jgi:hypothetical protein